MAGDKVRTFHLMTSALVEVLDNTGKPHKCRMLLDTCATANFITENFAKKLKLSMSEFHLPISALNGMSTSTKYSIKVTINSIHNAFKKSFTFYTVPKITDLVPVEVIPKGIVNIPSNIRLADPEFYKPAPIDMLIGAGPTLSLFNIGQIKLSEDNDLFLQKTLLGWVIGGECSAVVTPKKYACLVTDIQFNLERFWEMEERNSSKRTLSVEEDNCEKHFCNNVTRNQNGRYVVALPFKDHHPK